MPDYKDTGIIFPRDTSRNNKAPVFSGNIELSTEMAEYVIAELAAGRDGKLDIAFWEKAGRKGSFYSGTIKKPQPPQGNAAPPQRTGQSGPAPRPSQDLDDEIPF